jgi:hypothetical protein
MSFVIMELKPAEVEYLNSMWRCPKCDHLMALHAEDRMTVYRSHCDDCIDEECAGSISFVAAHCRIETCPCGEDA